MQIRAQAIIVNHMCYPGFAAYFAVLYHFNIVIVVKRSLSFDHVIHQNAHPQPHQESGILVLPFLSPIRCVCSFLCSALLKAERVGPPDATRDR